jgi:hypothetical protein
LDGLSKLIHKIDPRLNLSREKCVVGVNFGDNFDKSAFDKRSKKAR